jgi:hypothetical protein
VGDEKNKKEIERLARQLHIDVDSVETITDLDKLNERIKELGELSCSKVQVYIVERANDDSPGGNIGFNFNENDATVSFDNFKSRLDANQIQDPDNYKAVLQADAATWGPFSGVFPAQSGGDGNLAKFNKIKQNIDNIFTSIKSGKNRVFIIFGYGYSGSGKTFTLFGKNATATATATDGITQHAIRHCMKSGYKVSIESIFEMYSESYYMPSGTGHYTYRQVKPLYYTVHKEPKKSEEYTIQETIQEASDPKPKFQSGTVPNLDLEQIPGYIGYFNTILRRVDIHRKSKGRIFPTPNNNESSRGHLFVTLTISKEDGSGSGPKATGKLVICDMGGRENPNEIWKTSYYCVNPQAKDKGPAEVLGPCIRSSCPAKDTCRYYRFPRIIEGSNDFNTSEITSEKCKNPIEAYNTVLKETTKGNAPPLYQALQAMQGTMIPSATHIVRTLKQGFYINDSINELMMRFGDAKLEQRSSAWTKSEYNPAIRVTGHDNPQLVGIENVFKNLETDFSRKGGDSDKGVSVSYCTFACIRSTPAFFEDTLNTLKFASQVNSVVNTKTPTSAAVSTLSETPSSPGVHKRGVAMSSQKKQAFATVGRASSQTPPANSSRGFAALRRLPPNKGGKRTRRRRNLALAFAFTEFKFK